VFSEGKSIYEVLEGKNPIQRATFIAYVLAPAFILGVSVYGLFGASINFEKPIAIAELKVEIGQKGEYASRRGVVLIAEPSECEFGLPLAGASKIWSSINQQTTPENLSRNHLGIDAGGLYGKAPFLGESGPVTLVVDGSLADQINVSGSQESLDDWRLISRQSSSVLSAAFAACLLTFGMTFALGMSRVEGDENYAGEKRTKPNEN